jgi:hypothetical protein
MVLTSRDSIPRTVSSENGIDSRLWLVSRLAVFRYDLQSYGWAALGFKRFIVRARNHILAAEKPGKRLAMVLCAFFAEWMR